MKGCWSGRSEGSGGIVILWWVVFWGLMGWWWGWCSWCFCWCRGFFVRWCYCCVCGRYCVFCLCFRFCLWCRFREFWGCVGVEGCGECVWFFWGWLDFRFGCCCGCDRDCGWLILSCVGCFYWCLFILCLGSFGWWWLCWLLWWVDCWRWVGMKFCCCCYVRCYWLLYWFRLFLGCWLWCWLLWCGLICWWGWCCGILCWRVGLDWGWFVCCLVWRVCKWRVRWWGCRVGEGLEGGWVLVMFL